MESCSSNPLRGLIIAEQIMAVIREELRIAKRCHKDALKVLVFHFVKTELITQKQAAEMLGCSRENVNSQIQEIRCILEARLKGTADAEKL